MHNIDIFVDGDDRKRRRGKWLLPLLVGVVAAFALGREKPPVIRGAPASSPAGPAASSPPSPVRGAETAPGQPAGRQRSAVDPPPPPLLPPRLAAGPLRLDFGDGPLTRGVPAQMATIRNDGGQPLPRLAIAIDRPFLATNGCIGELAPGAQCMIAVVFAPPQPGKFAGSLRIAAGAERAQIALRGSVPRPREVVTPVATAPPTVVVQIPPPPPVPSPQLPPARFLCFQPALLRFTTTGRQTITLTNPEPVPLRVVAVVPLGRRGQTISGYEIEARKCLRVLKPGQQCKFTVRANELALQMRETMQLTVYYDDPLTGGRRAAQFNATCGR
jgi:hypothetical protein